MISPEISLISLFPSALNDLLFLLLDITFNFTSSHGLNARLPQCFKICTIRS